LLVSRTQGVGTVIAYWFGTPVPVVVFEFVGFLTHVECVIFA
jgi:hypothetical protein